VPTVRFLRLRYIEQREIAMELKGNTILITGGGSGIGRGLAEAFHAEGNQVIIAGRRREALDETIAANPGIKGMTFDVGDRNSVLNFARQISSDYPALNVVIQNAGIMKMEDIKEGETGDAEATIATNLLGPIRLTAALLPHLLSKPQAAIMTVSSGLAFVPLATTPTYCATKAAIHSYSQSLRYQLRNTAVQIIELIPPYVQTELMGTHQANDPAAMPLKDFIAESMRILRSAPDSTEICVERVKPLRNAEASGNYAAFFREFNDRVAATLKS